MVRPRLDARSSVRNPRVAAQADNGALYCRDDKQKYVRRTFRHLQPPSCAVIFDTGATGAPSVSSQLRSFVSIVVTCLSVHLPPARSPEPKRREVCLATPRAKPHVCVHRVCHAARFFGRRFSHAQSAAASFCAPTPCCALAARLSGSAVHELDALAWSVES